MNKPRGPRGPQSTSKGRHSPVVAAEYRKMRIARGSQKEVAEALGVTAVTISNRENCRVPISSEALAALEPLPLKENGK